ncbi:macrolide transporter subunit MacA [Jeongeupia chitinilytica]|uniref:Drug-efflux protein n=1 Tax=Jeongeupia chitinilytica TaxID=1041641 RepID=A0ABQ3GUJ0_9NEIS|nr:macrolide transporter subunit MacA [Jeongeupia chitinilytica]GHD55567.1 drug-efflux protein [Jeongeupia chitinilytica]
MKKKPLRWLTAIALLVPAVWLIARLAFPPAPPHYLTAPVARMDLEETVLASGTLKPVKQVSVGAQVNGQLRSLKVKLGDRVSKGQLLAEIDPVLQQNELRKAEAGLARAEADKRAKAAQLVQFELALKRQKTMLVSDASSRADLETAQAQLDSTRAELAALAAQIRQATVDVDTARANLGYTRIVAPMDGEIISVVTQEGQTVVSAQSAPTILIMANLDTMTIKAQVSEADVVRVKPGQPVYFTILGAPGKRFYSTLRAIEPAPESIGTESSQSTTGSTTTAVYYNGLFDVPNPNHVLKTSMTAQVSVVQGAAKQVLAVPVAALGKQEKDGRYAVRVLEQGKPQDRKVRIGLNDNVNAQVLAGLNEGDKVIVGDPAQLPVEKPSEVGF